MSKGKRISNLQIQRKVQMKNNRKKKEMEEKQRKEAEAREIEQERSSEEDRERKETFFCPILSESVYCKDCPISEGCKDACTHMEENRGLLTHYILGYLAPIIKGEFTEFVGTIDEYDENVGAVDDYKKQSPKQIKAIQNALTPLLSMGYVIPFSGCTQYLSHAILNRKSDGEKSIFLHLKKLNSLVMPFPYQPDRREDINFMLQGKKIFSKIYLDEPWKEIPLNEESIPKTTFKVGKKMYQFTVLPVGYKNTQKFIHLAISLIVPQYMNTVFFVAEGALFFFSKTEKEHVQSIISTLHILKINGFTIDSTKSRFFCKDTTIFGCTVANDTIQPSKWLISSLTNFPTPRKTKDIRRFIGKLSSVKMFLPDRSVLTAPFSVFLQKEASFSWCSKMQKAFEDIKAALLKITPLSLPKKMHTFTIEIKLSKEHMFSTLKQDEKPIEYYSKSISSSLLKYSLVKQELYMILWTLIKAREYIRYEKIVLECSEKAYELLTNRKKCNSFVLLNMYRTFKKENLDGIKISNKPLRSVLQK